MAFGGGYGGPNFGQIESELRNIAIHFGAILSVTTQLRASVDVFRQLEVELTNTLAAAGGGVQTFKDLESAARGFALASTYSASQVANAFYSLASAGLNAKQVMSAASGVILLAQATMVDLGVASDLTANAMSQFGLASSDATRIANVFVASANESLSTVNKLAFALKQVGPIAAQAGLSLEQTVGILDKMFDSGLRGEQAGTALRNVLAGIIDPSSKARLVLQNLGVTTRDAAGGLRNVVDVLKDLNNAHISQADIFNLAGREGAVGLTSVLKSLQSTGDATTALERHIQSLTGTMAAYRQATLQLNTMDGAIRQAQNSFNDLRITLGEALAPVVVSLSNSFVKFSDGLKDMNEGGVRALATMVGMGVQAALLYKGLNAVGPAFQGIAAGMSQLQRAGLTGSFAAANFGRAGSAASLGAGLLQSSGIAARAGQTGFATQAAADGMKALGAASKQAGIGIAAGALAMGEAAAGALALAGAVAGVIGFAAAIGGVAIALGKFKQAQDDAHFNKSVSSLLSGLTPGSAEEKANVADLSNPLPILNRAIQNLNGQFPVDAGSGTGAFNRAGAIRDLVAQNKDAYLRTNQQISELKSSLTGENLKKVNDTFSSLREFYLSISQGEVASATIADQAFNQAAGAIQRTFGANSQAMINFKEAANKSVTDIAATDRPEQYKVAFQNYYAQLAEALRASGASSPELQRKLLEQGRAVSQQFAQLPVAIQGVVIAELKKGQDAAARKLETGKLNPIDYDPTKIISDAIEAGVSTANPDGGRLAALYSQLDYRVRSYVGNVTNLNRELVTNTSGSLAKELSSAVLQSQSSNDAAFKKLGDFLKVHPEVVQRAVLDAITSGKDLQGAMKQVFDTLRQQRVLTSEQASQGVDNLLATPLFNPTEIAEKLAKANLNLIQSQVDAAMQEGTATPDQVRQLIAAKRTEAINAQAADVANGLSKAVGDQFLQNITRNGGKGDTKEADVAGRQFASDVLGPYSQSFAEALQTGSADKVMEVLAKAANARVTKLDGSTSQTFRGFAEAAVKNFQAQMNRLGAEQNGLLRQVGKKGGVGDDVLKALIGLPTDQDYATEFAKSEQNAKYALSQYLNLPFAAIDKAFGDADLTYASKITDIRKKFDGYFKEHLIKDLTATVQDPLMQQAINGTLISQLFSDNTKSVEIDGTKFTGQLISTTDGMQLFLDTVTDRFARIAANGNKADERVRAFRSTLVGVTKEVSGAIDEQRAGLQVLGLKQADVEEAARRFATQFRSDNLERMLQQAMLAATRRPVPIEVLVDLSIKAQQAKVELEADEEIAKIREAFQKKFANLNFGIPIGLQSNGQLVVGNQATNRGVTLPNTALASDNGLGNALAALGLGGGGGATGSNKIDRNALIAAITGQESGGRVGIVNKQYGAAGLMQVIPDTAKAMAARLGVDYRSDLMKGHSEAAAAYQKQIGEAYIDYLMELKGNTLDSLDEVIMSYYAGPGGGNRKGKTAAYDTQVRARYGKLAGVSGPSGGVVASLPGVDGVQGVGAVPSSQQATLTPEQQKVVAYYKDQLKQFEQQVRDNRDAMLSFIAGMSATDRSIQVQASILDTATTQYGKMGGSIDKDKEKLADFRAQLADTAVSLAALGVQNGTAGRGDLLNSIYAKQGADLDAQSQKQISAVRLQAATLTALAPTEEARNRIAGELVEAEKTITDNLARQKSLIVGNIEARRKELDTLIQQRTQGNNGIGENGGQLFSGLVAGAQTAAKDMATPFETGLNIARNSITDFAAAGAEAMTNLSSDFGQATAQILQNISKMIIQMLIMQAIMWALRAAGIPLGGGGIVAPGGVNEIAPIQMGFTPLALGGAMFAGGGIHQMIAAANGFAKAVPATRHDMTQGGIKSANNPHIAIFGEGQWPEAFIPMTDRKSIPVTMGSDGQMYVQVPSGQKIPARLAPSSSRGNGKFGSNMFAQGGTSGNVTQMRMNDGMTGGSLPPPVIAGGDTFHISPTIILQGKATRDDASMVSAQVVAQAAAMLKARDRENSMKLMKSGMVPKYDGRIKSR